MHADAEKLPSKTRVIVGYVNERSSGTEVKSPYSQNIFPLGPVVYLVDTFFTRAFLITRGISDEQVRHALMRLRSHAPDLRVEWIRSGEAIEEAVLRKERIILKVSLFLVLACGIVATASVFSLLQEWIRANRQSFAIRFALGADSGSMFVLIMKPILGAVGGALVLSIPGLVIGVKLLSLEFGLAGYSMAAAASTFGVTLVMVLVTLPQIMQLNRLDLQRLTADYAI